MAEKRPLIYPGADHKTQWYGGIWNDGIMALTAPVLVLHDTEGYGWPDWGNGGSAPHFTIWPGHGVRQHFDINEGARALITHNNDGAIQIELVGSCLPQKPGVFWPHVSDTDMKELVALTRWLRDNWGLKVQSSVKWFPYTGIATDTTSGGFHAANRLSYSDWLAYEGILGHEHVPDNDHGDPGNFPIGRLIQLVNGAVPAKTPAPTPVVKRADATWNHESVQVGTNPDGSPDVWDASHAYRHQMDVLTTTNKKLDAIMNKLGVTL